MNKLNNIIFFLLCIVLVACSNSAGSTQSGEEQNTQPNTSSEQENYVLTLSHGYPASSFMHTFMEWFDEEVQERSDGRLSLEIYPNSQLMPSDQEIPSILQGQIDMTHIASPVLASFDPIWNFYELPFIFEYDPQDPAVFLENRMEFNHNEAGGRKIIEMMEERGLKILSLGFVDMFGSVYTTDANNLVTGPESAEGLRLRSPGGLIGPETVSAMGASSVTIAASEVTTALQQGIVDGLLTTPIFADDAKLPVKSFSLVPLFNTVTPVIISQEKFDSLPEDLQTILLQTGQELEEYAMETVLERTKTAYTTLENEGVDIYYPTEEEIKEWQKATEPVRAVFEEEVEAGSELLEVLDE
ncbi:TRAP transporter substrate-binding protein [Desertibacillus haloalkaliphilus]|uniref:TRAP transporter substrate-binding protein n=1 Tax=Desertibacillus haloalkaliphilus TaxID=1328930 RepID=UPI001C2790B5|nr:TRAP transporter substrate-binding protein [Desertibacillus haloalkaliphilus]MBU8906239.1 TRAP transporter substrate-binding protein [Desertibacillus haloalkaliphilus]